MASRRLSEELERPSALAKFFARELPGPMPEAGADLGEDAGTGATPAAEHRQVAPPALSSAGVIGRRLRRRLVQVATAELDARQFSLGVALYFDRHALRGWSRLFREGSADHGRDADRVLAYLATGDVPFRLPSVAGARTRYRAPRRALQQALRVELQVAGHVETAIDVAMARRDYRSLQVLAACLEAQAAREWRLRQLLALVASGANLFEAEPLLDRLT